MTELHSDYTTLIRNTIAYLKENSAFIFATKEEWEILYRNTLKNQEFHKGNFEKKLTLSKTDSSGCFGIHGLKGEPPTSSGAKINSSASSVETSVCTRIPPPMKESSPENIPGKKVSLAQEKPPSRIPGPSSQKIKNFLQHSSVPLTEHIPDDSAATKEMSAYKEYIGAVDTVIFACDADPDTLSLIKNLSKSIDQKLGPVKVLRSDRWEKEGRWDAFLAKNPIKLVIASSGFSQLKGAMSLYMSPDGGSSSFLKNIPLIILSPCAVYSQSPKEKLILWNQICSLLKT